MFSIHIEDLVSVCLLSSEMSVLKKKEAKINFKFPIFAIEITLHYITYQQIEKRIRLSFGVLLFNIPYNEPEIPPFY